MKNIILFIVCICSAQLMKAQVTMSVGSGAFMIVSGASHVVIDSGSFVNDGTYIDSTGTLKASGGVAFSGSGTTRLNDLMISNSQTTNVNALVSVYNTATLDAGNLNANNNLYIRSDANTTSNMVVTGLLHNTVRGLIARATVTTGVTPYTSDLTLNVSGPAMEYQWQSSPDSSTWTDAPGATAAVYTATVSATKWYRCHLATNNTVHVQATPGVKLNFTGTVPPITGGGSVCVGGNITLSNTMSGGTWSSVNTSVGTVNATSGVVTGISAGTTTISYIVPGGAFVTTEITVNVTPTAITGVLVMCAEATSSLASSPSGGSWTSDALSVATVGTSSGLAAGVAAGTANITYTINGACSTKVTVTVNGVPAAITGSMTLCVGNNVVLGSATTGGAWSSDNTTVATVGASTGIVTGSGVGTATISYSNGSCARSVVVTVNGAIAANTGLMEICAGISVTLSNTTTGGTWYGADDAVATVNAATGLLTGVSNGVLNVTYTASAGCYSVSEVTVNPAVAAIGGTLGLCNGGTTALTNATGGGVWSSTNTFSATIGSASGMVTSVAAGTTTISYVLSAGCFAQAEFTVNTSPTSISGTVSVCQGTSAALSSSPTGGTWSSIDPSIATVNAATGMFTGVGSGTTNINYTLSTGCATSVVVTSNPVPAAISGGLTICAESTTTLTSATTGGTWTSGTTGVATVGASSGIVTGVSAGTAGITYAISGGCYVTTIVSINATPGVITGSLSVCAGSTSALGSSTSGGTWSSTNTGVATIDATTGLVTAVSLGTSLISYTNGTCYRTAVVTIGAGATANTGVATVCIGQATTLSNTTSGGTWSSGNASVATVNASTGLVTGIAGGTADISYILSAGCFAVTVVTVNTSLPAITGTLGICLGETTALANSVSGGTWSSTNTTKATINASSGIAIAVATGTTTISYVASGCYALATLTINSNPGTVNGTAAICSGATTGLTCSPGGGTWSTSDAGIATVGATGVVTGTGSGTVTISYTIGSGCSSTKVVTVNAAPTAITGSLYTCAGSTTALASSPAGGVWSSSTNSKATVNSGTGVVTGVSSGTTRISYVLSGCYTYDVVTVGATPSTITGVLSLCSGSTTALGSATTGGTWSSDDGAIATINTSTGVVTGTGSGTVTIRYSNGTCERTAVVTVNAAMASSTGNMPVCVGQGAYLANTASGGTWVSSATAIATVTSASGLVAGVSAGTANITYKLSATCYTITVVTINPALAAITGTLSVCPGATTALSHAISGGTWSSSIPARATIDISSGVATGVAAGNTTITYSLTAGCYKVATLAVSNGPAAISGTAAVCQGATTALTCTPSGGTWSSSATGVATVVTGVVTGVSLGTATISYIVGSGCYATREVTVTAAPSAITGSATACVGTVTTLGGSPAGGTWSSSFPAKATVNATTGDVTGIATGTTRITYTISAGCFTTTIVTVNNLPAAIAGVLTLCTGGTTNLSSATFSGVWTSVTGAVATVVAGTGVVSGISTGTSTISYTKNGCSATAVVTVNTASGTITGNAVVCVGQTNSTLSSGLSGGTWSSSASAIASVHATTGLITGGSVGTATITYTSSPGCFITSVATVNAALPAITGPATVILGNTITLANGTAGGTWSSSNTTKATINSATGDMTGVAAGTTTITYSVSTGCYVTKTETVTYARPGTIAGASGIFSVYPNPSIGKLVIEAPVTGLLTVYTIDGKMVQECPIKDAVTSIMLPKDLASGVYMLRFKGDDDSIESVRLVYQP